MSTHPYPRLLILPAPPDADNDESEGYELGDTAHVIGGSVYVCRDPSIGAAVWEEQGSGSGFDIHALTEKTSIADNDEFPQADSEDGFDPKRNKWSTIKESIVNAILDYGPNEIENNTLDSDAAGWTLGAGWAWESDGSGGGWIRHTAGNTAELLQSGELLPGSRYYVALVIGGTVGEITVSLTGGGSESIVVSATDEGLETTLSYLEGGLYSIFIQPSSDFDGYIDEFYVMRMPVVSEAPTDGGIYGRQSSGWAALGDSAIKNTGTGSDEVAAGDHTHTPAALGAIPSDGWIAGSGTWSYSSADSPVFVASIPDGDAANINIGDRIKLTQTTVKYFIVVAKGSPSAGFTPVTIYGGTDYTLANSAISSPAYSHVKSPLGFPLSPAKWTVTATDTSDRTQASPVQNTWYNLGSISISAPIGLWNLSYIVAAYADRASAGFITLFSTLSTANNSESTPAHTRSWMGNNILGMTQPLHIDNIILSLAAKTTYYLNAKTGATSVSSINFFGAGSTPSTIKLVCAYL